jgi:tRNA pseudouridine55 synthase
MDGFLILDKPEGITSAQCVYKLRSILGTKRIGHCGTLDPLATGLLPICVGEATKFSNYATNLDKVYEVEIKFGVETDTGDITGKIISKKDSNRIDQVLNKQLKKLECVHFQMPPMYSAVKKNGKPLYYWARKGVYLYRDPRRIKIKSIKLLNCSEYSATIEVACSKGTYIRTLVEQLGRSLGTFATVSSLRRLEVGSMKLSTNSCHLEDTKDNIVNTILPCDALLSDMDKITLKPEDAKKVRNGLSIDYNAHLKNKGLVRIYTDKNLFIGLGLVGNNNMIQPKRLLATN